MTSHAHRTDAPSTWPLWIKLAVWLCFFNSWVLFEETVIDRHGLWSYLPLYRLGDPCLWDLAAAIAIGALVWRGFRSRDAG